MINQKSLFDTSEHVETSLETAVFQVIPRLSAAIFKLEQILQIEYSFN